MVDKRLDRVWAEIDLDNIAHNLREIRRTTGNSILVMAVVKANAYGHGAVRTAAALIKSGADRLAVASLDEALLLRKNGFDTPVQVLGHTSPGRVKEILDYNIIQTVFNSEMAYALSAEAISRHVRARVHIKVNTGMNRIGFLPDKSGIISVVEICRLPGIEAEGIMTHFSSADEEDTSYTYMQFDRFMAFCGELSGKGVHIPVKHVCNSAAVFRYPEMHLTMIRPGIALYGLYPTQFIDRRLIGLKPVMTLKTRVVSVNCLQEGVSLGYGRKFTTARQSLIATISAGYGDGYSRLLSKGGKVLIHGEEAPLAGTVCMDQCMVDVTDLNEKARVGDEVVLFGKQGESEIFAEKLAEDIGTIGYEVVCNVGMRVPRAYIENCAVADIQNYLFSV